MNQSISQKPNLNSNGRGQSTLLRARMTYDTTGIGIANRYRFSGAEPPTRYNDVLDAKSTIPGNLATHAPSSVVTFSFSS